MTTLHDYITHTHIHTYTHTHAHTYTRTRAHTYTHTCQIYQDLVVGWLLPWRWWRGLVGACAGSQGHKRSGCIVTR